MYEVEFLDMGRYCAQGGELIQFFQAGIGATNWLIFYKWIWSTTPKHAQMTLK